MEIAPFIIPVISSAVGTAISLLLIVLLRRQTERDTSARIGIILGIAVCAMYLSFGGSAFCKYYGMALPERLSTVFSLLIASFLPTLILWSWRVSPVLRWKTRISYSLLVLASLNGFLIVGALLWLSLNGQDELRVTDLLILNSLVCLIPAVISILRLPLDRRLRAFMRISCSIYIFGSLISFVRPGGAGETGIPSIFGQLLMQTCLLGGFLGSFIIAARFRFIDVFVRWSTRLAILGIFSTIETLSFIAAIRIQSPWSATGLLACAFEMILLLLLGIVLTERCERWVESHVLQRTDLKAEAERLHTVLFTNETPAKLFAFMEKELTRCLEVRQVKVLSQSTIPQELLAAPNLQYESFEVPARFAPLSIAALEEIETLVPIPSEGKNEKVIAVATGVGRRSLHSGEIRFLRDIGQYLGVRLHQLELDAATRKQVLRESLLRQQLTEAELRALRAQVNPHFLFNSLNTIADLIVRKPVNAERMTLRLSRVFRHVLAQSNRQFVTLQEEFDFLRNYLDIEQERFGETLKVSIELDPQIAHAFIPTLLMQPLVENALKHGIAPKGGQCTLCIAAKSAGGRMQLTVIDDGMGFSCFTSESQQIDQPQSKSGVGLANTLARLQAVYGEEGMLVIDSAPMRGCRVSISLPLKEVRR